MSTTSLVATVSFTKNVMESNGVIKRGNRISMLLPAFYIHVVNEGGD